jgi:hypothetical protein
VRGQVVFYLGDAWNAETSEIMYSKEFPTESLGLFSYGLLKIVLNFVPIQNILIRRGTSPISSTRHLSSKIIEIRAPRAIMHQIARSLFHNTLKNILDISVSSEYFISTGDSPISI